MEFKTKFNIKDKVYFFWRRNIVCGTVEYIECFTGHKKEKISEGVKHNHNYKEVFCQYRVYSSKYKTDFFPTENDVFESEKELNINRKSEN